MREKMVGDECPHTGMLGCGMGRELADLKRACDQNAEHATMLYAERDKLAELAAKLQEECDRAFRSERTAWIEREAKYNENARLVRILKTAIQLLDGSQPTDVSGCLMMLRSTLVDYMPI